jgi:hypothetical protein
MTSLIAKYLLARLFFVAWAVIGGSPLWLVTWSLRDNAHPALVWVLVPPILAWLVASWCLGKTMARYMVDENKSFLDAVKFTLCEFRFQSACLPVVGGLFTPDEDKTHYDDDDA